MDLFSRSDIFMFFVWWVSYPCVLKALIYKGFQLSQSFTLDINVTHSTCLVRQNSASWAVSGKPSNNPCSLSTWNSFFPSPVLRLKSSTDSNLPCSLALTMAPAALFPSPGIDVNGGISASPSGMYLVAWDRYKSC